MGSASPKSSIETDPELEFTQLSGIAVDDLWSETNAESVGLTAAELAAALTAIGVKYNWGLPAGIEASRMQSASFSRALQLRDLVLAQACALGRETAWQQFFTRFKTPLTQAAIAITGSASAGQELADSLYSEMFGLSSRDGERRSPLASYAGRGSLMGFLRTSLTQRHVDQHRRMYRETAINGQDFPAPAPSSPLPELLARLAACLAILLRGLDSEERFVISAWFLDRQTLADIGRVLGVHEATVSRRITRLTARLQKELIHHLEMSGLSRQAAEQALGTDPRDLNINLRSLLQSSQPATFQVQGTAVKEQP